MTRLLAMAILLSGCLSPLVGAECRAGLVACDGRCVDLTSNAQRCGACDAPCAAGEACIEGACAAADYDAGGPPDGSAGAITDAGAPPALRPVPREPVGTIPGPVIPPSCGLGELACSVGCVRADRDPSHCGTCENACATGEACVAGACAATCPTPLVACGALCIDARRDPDHCGACGARCDTGVCVDGTCESEVAGHLVVIGHDYTSHRAAMSRLVGNAVLLPSRRSVRVLAYEGGVSAESRAGTIAAIDATAGTSGRAWEMEVVGAERVSYRLAFADVLVLHAQSGLTRTDALRIGSHWRTALTSFLQRGGTAVALVSVADGAGTLDILEAAGAIEELAAAPADITGARLTTVRSWDAVAVGVPLAYLAERSTVRLPLELDDAVVSDGVGPVVVHRAIARP